MPFARVAAVFFAVLTYSQAASGEVRINIDTSLADRTLALVCSGAPVDEAAVRASPIVQAQIDHNSGLIDAATMDNYVAALRGASACQAPDPDPFRVAHVIANRDAYRRKVDALKAMQDELAADIARQIAPYMPTDMNFSGDVVLAVPYFSCGGFAAQGRFFIDLRCLGDDIAADREALTQLMAHETYHAIQEQMFFDEGDDEEMRTTYDGLRLFFQNLVVEGSAYYVGSRTALPATGGGPLTNLNRGFAQTNAGRMRINFALLSILIEHVRRARDVEETTNTAARIAFSGSSYQEMGYYVGSQMAGDIEAAWGAPALVCVLQQPAEQFVLAHDAAVAGNAEKLRLSPAAIEAARYVAQRRRGAGGRFESCRPD